jgi:hypothetical protein
MFGVTFGVAKPTRILSHGTFEKSGKLQVLGFAFLHFWPFSSLCYGAIT